MLLVGHLLFTKTKTNVFGLPERIDWMLDHGNKKHTSVKFHMVNIFYGLLVYSQKRTRPLYCIHQHKYNYIGFNE